MTGVRSANPYQQFHGAEGGGSRSSSVGASSIWAPERAQSLPLGRQSSTDSSTKGFFRSSIDKVWLQIDKCISFLIDIILLVFQWHKTVQLIHGGSR